jgi:hypothetical protein
VSYWPWDYYAYRKDAPLSDTFNDAEEMVEWKLEPPPLVAMQDFARWEEAEVGFAPALGDVVIDTRLFAALGCLGRAIIFLLFICLANYYLLRRLQ